MKLNVEISAKASWYEDRMRRKMKRAVTEAINDVIDAMENEYAELNSLRFVIPTAKKRRKKVTA